jgi:SAM-dependent methyltransferase
MSEPEFDRFADSYDAALERGISVSGEDKTYFARGRVQWLQRHLAERGVRPSRVLDYGCGTGTATPYLLELAGVERVHGVDISARSIEVACRTQATARASFSTDSACPPDASFDLVFCNGVFHHIPLDQRAGALRYILASLRPGGLFALWENNPWNPGTQLVMARIPFDRDAIKLSPRTARRLVGGAGFEVESITFQFIFPAALSLLRRLECPLARLPFGAQYMVLARKAAAAGAAASTCATRAGGHQ